MSAKTRKKQNKNEKNKQEIDSDTMDFSGWFFVQGSPKPIIDQNK